MNDKLIIPKICKAGFNLRKDTYSGKLAYVIYKDNKNVWRKETSWESWRQKEGQNKTYKDDSKKFGPEVAPLEFENVPTEGFVLNKKVGGHSSGWNHRSTYARVYDPRGFEIEVTLENLLFILQETDCSRGKGLLGEFVYSYSGKDLILLPCSSLDYQESLKFTKMQDNKIAAKDLIPGATYKKKNGDSTIYLGRLPFINPDSWSYFTPKEGKRNLVPKADHIFTREGWRGQEFYAASASILAEISDPNPHPDYAKLMEKYSNSNHSKTVNLSLEPSNKDHYRETRYKYHNIDGKEVLICGPSYSGGGYYSYGRRGFNPNFIVEMNDKEINFKPLGKTLELSDTNLLKLNIKFI